MMGIVYVLENKTNGKCYVGQTCNLKSRLTNHSHSRSLIGNAIRKYGLEGFRISINEVPEELRDVLETNLIRLYGSIAPGGYNLDSGGHFQKHHHAVTVKKMKATARAMGKKFPPGAREKALMAITGKPLSSAHKEKLRAALSGSKNPQFGKPGPMLGKHLSQNTRNRLREINLGRSFSRETRAKMSASAKRKPPVSQATRQKIADSMRGILNPFFGKHHTEDARRKMSDSRRGEKNWCFGKHPGLGRHPGEETRRKMSEAHKGIKFSEEHRAKIGLAHKGYRHSEEARQRMREAALVREKAKRTVAE